MKMTEPAKICVLITGASSGIGAGLAREFSRRGMRVALVARRIAQLEVLAGELRAAGAQASAHCGDVTVDGDIARVVGELSALGVAPHIVIANAGFGVVGNAANLDLADYRRQFETNVFGVLRTIQVGLEALKRSKGTLVLIGSVSSYISAPEASAYSMSKFAVRALAEALRAELARDGVSVVLITPGFVKSQIRQVDNQGEYRSSAKDPIPEWMQMSAENAAKKIAKAVLKKKRERVITFHGKVFVLLQRFFPGLSAWFFKRAGKKFRSRNPSLNA